GLLCAQAPFPDPGAPQLTEFPCGAVAECPEGPGCCQDLPECNRFWFAGDYLLWWIKKGPLPLAIATTGNVTDAVPGAFGQPGTRPLLGNSEFDYKAFSGLRLSAGTCLDAEQTCGLEASAFLLERRATSQTVGS